MAKRLKMAEIHSPRKTRSGRLLGGVTHGGGVEGPRNATVEVPAVEEIVREETVADIIDLTEDYIDVDDDDDDAFGDLLGDVTGTTSHEDNAEDRNITIVNDDTQTGDTTDNVIDEEGTQGNEDIAEDVNNDSVDMFDDSFDVPDGSIDDMMATLGDETGATINEDNEGGEIITIVDDDTPTDETTDDADEDRIQGTVHDVTVDLTDSPLPTSSSTVFTLPGTGRDVQSRPQKRIFGSTSSPTSGASLLSTSSSSMPSTPSTSGASVSATPPSTSGASSTAASSSSAGVTCRICLESQSDLEKEGLNLLSTVCGHIFCSKCLPSYIKNKGLCPICRKVLRPKDFHQIFL